MDAEVVVFQSRSLGGGGGGNLMYSMIFSFGFIVLKIQIDSMTKGGG